MKYLLAKACYLCGPLFLPPQVVEFPNAEGPLEFGYDEEWLAVLRSTHSLMSLRPAPVTLPGVFNPTNMSTQHCANVSTLYSVFVHKLPLTSCPALSAAIALKVLFAPAVYQNLARACRGRLWHASSDSCWYKL